MRATHSLPVLRKPHVVRGGRCSVNTLWQWTGREPVTLKNIKASISPNCRASQSYRVLSKGAHDFSDSETKHMARAGWSVSKPHPRNHCVGVSSDIDTDESVCISIAPFLADWRTVMDIRKQPLAASAMLALTFAVTAWTTASAAPAADDKIVKLSGCLIRGEGDGAGYLLMNASAEPWLRSPGRQVTPSALGTSGDNATLFYWLNGSGDLKQHIGHRVEIEGNLKGDLKEGEITTDRKDNWTVITVKAGGRTMKANVPNTSMFPASDRDKGRKRLRF